MESFTAKASSFPDLIGQIGTKINAKKADPLGRLFESMRDAFSGTCTPVQAKAEMQRLAPDMEFLEPDNCPICGTPTNKNGRCTQPTRDNL